MSNQVAFARWQSSVPSGGNRYDDALTSALKARGITVQEYPVEGSWRSPNQHDRETFKKLLTANIQHPQHWLIDNIVGAAVPEILQTAVKAGHTVTMLMHFFAADETGLTDTVRAEFAALEAKAVSVATTIIATSEWTANEITKRYGRDDVTVALPGVASANIASGSRDSGSAPMILWLGRLTQTKDPLTLVEALATLTKLDWSAHIVGPDTIDPACSDELRKRIIDLGLDTRIVTPGAREGEELDVIWAQTDLLVHTSRSEAYGMVVTEALARGIPCIVPAGTGAEEAQHGAGGTFPAGDSAALSVMIRNWLTDTQLQDRWRAEAISQREKLPTWRDAAETVETAMNLNP